MSYFISSDLRKTNQSNWCWQLGSEKKSNEIFALRRPWMFYGNNDSLHLLNAYYMPNTILNVLLLLTHLMFIATLKVLLGWAISFKRPSEKWECTVLRSKRMHLFFSAFLLSYSVIFICNLMFCSFVAGKPTLSLVFLLKMR